MTPKNEPLSLDPTQPSWLPDPALFERLHRPGVSLPVLLVAPDPGCDPVDVLAALAGRSIAYLLETPGGPPDLPRRTFLAWDPEFEIRVHRGWIETWSGGFCRVRKKVLDPLADLRDIWRRQGAAPVPYGRGFLGGYIGYVAYDFKNHLERLPDTVQDDLGVPELRFGFVRRVLAWDPKDGTVCLSTSVRCGDDPARDLARAREELLEQYAELERVAARPRSDVTVSTGRLERPRVLQSNLDRSEYDLMLARAHEYILAGDIYQANLSHRFESSFEGSGLELYRRLRRINPSPFAAYLRFSEHEIASSSPERLVCLEGGRVETRPIAGTSTRVREGLVGGDSPEELLGSEKERAEHLMIVDMARNDIGRVCEYGSVRVERFMSVEAYSHVRHLVSNIVGRIKPDEDPFDLLAAVFPGASVTGVPKIRCMQIIDELEVLRRGLYTGSAGYIGLNGSMDFNILIRTFLLQNGKAYFQVGGGIVADSETEREYQETLAKGQALQEALLGTTRSSVLLEQSQSTQTEFRGWAGP